MQRVSVIGCGRLGICASLLMESKGIGVFCVDKNKSYLEDLHFRRHKTSEPSVEEMLKDARQIEFSSKLDDALNFSSLWMCFVPTPSLPTGEYDHQYIEEIIKGIYEYVDSGKSVSGKTLVIGCTVMPTYCHSLQERVRDMGLTIIYSPSLIAQGSICDNLASAELVIIGAEPQSVPIDLLEMYHLIMGKKPRFKYLSHTGAEITKIAINCYLTTKISFANYIGQVAINSGLENEVDNILIAIGSDSRIGEKYIKYGFGFSGVCLPRDNKALGIYSESIDVLPTLPYTTDNFNKAHLQFLFSYYVQANKGGKIPFIFNQLSYKPKVDNLTESQPYELCKLLLKMGYNIIINESEVIEKIVKEELKEYASQISFEEPTIGIEIN